MFARAPVPGEAKTRLIPLLGGEGAAMLHAALLRRALRCAIDAGIGEVALWCAPDASNPFFEACRNEFAVALRAQLPGDLGRRMLAAFEAQRGHLLLIGSDCPMLTPELLRLCASELERGLDAVFLPAEDGGYALIGLARPVASLFNGVGWSTERVMEETRARLRAAALSWSEPAIVWDVDRPRDVARLVASGLLPEWRSLVPSPAEGCDTGPGAITPM
ncbi:MAG: TIGR04282 family arsenosugar biosynthesis glycosyltransferase [Hyphomicrobiales bacterium]